jgi:hypothetical protein
MPDDTPSPNCPPAPLPPAVEALGDPRARDRARDLWNASTRLLEAIRLWRSWWLEFREAGDADPGLPVLWSRIAYDSLRAIFIHGARVHVAPEATLKEVLAWLPPVPDGFLGAPRYGWEAEGEYVVLGHDPSWQGRLLDWVTRGELWGALRKLDDLERGLRNLVWLLDTYPAAALDHCEQPLPSVLLLETGDPSASEAAPAAAGDTPPPAPPPPVPTRVLIDPDAGTATLDSQVFSNVDPDALRILQAIQTKGGNWISSTELQRLRGVGEGTRVDRILKKLPPELGVFFTGTPGRGYRWVESSHHSN